MKRKSFIAGLLIAALAGSSIYTQYGLGTAFAQSYMRSAERMQNKASRSDAIPSKADVASASNLLKTDEIDLEDSAYHYQKTINGVTITIDAEAGAIPKDAIIVITPIEKKMIKNQLVAFDIQFMLDGEEIQPESEVNVSFSMEQLPEGAEIFHISDKNKREDISSTVQGDGTITFTAEHFSVYGIALADTSDDPLGNPLVGGTADGDWKGNYVYYGWYYEPSSSDGYPEHYYYMEPMADSLNMYSLYSMNGKKYMGYSNRKAIKWRILNNDGNSLTLISDGLLGNHNYNEMLMSDDIPTWETSTVREWLNQMLSYMFFEDEERHLCDTLVTDKVPGETNITDGSDTIDRIYLPSLEDMVNPQYGFPANGEAKARIAEYVVYDDRYDNTAGNNSYWLRTRNSHSYGFLRPYHVTKEGECIAGGIQYYTWNLGMRPMIRVSIENEYLCTSEDDEMLSYGLRFLKEEESIAVGESLTLILQAIGKDFDLSKAEWGSSNGSIASVDNQGKITALSPGTAYIYAHIGQHFAGCKVTVTEKKEIVRYNVVFRDGEKIISSQQVEHGASAIPPELAKEGYELNWDKDYKNVTEDLTINAVWKAVGRYKINYELNGGVNHPLNPDHYEVGTSIIFQRPTREGYSFEGWYKTPDFQRGTEILLITKEMTGDVTLYAKWEKIASDPGSGSTGAGIGSGDAKPSEPDENNGGSGTDENNGGSGSSGSGGSSGGSGSSGSGGSSGGSGSSGSGGSSGGSGSSGSGGSSGGSSSSGSGGSSGGSGSSGSGRSSGGSSSGSSGPGALLPSYVEKGEWTTVNGFWHFSDASGKAYVNTWVAAYNPYAITGQQNYDWFRFDLNGNMMTGWFKDADGSYYFLNPLSDGTLGKMVTGWVWIADDSGVQRCYYFNPNSDGYRGRMLTNTVIDGYTVDANGCWTVYGVVQIK